MAISSHPRPIEGGQAAQAVVEYLGAGRGALGIRGPVSGRSYRFSALTSGRLQYVLKEDLPRFEQHVKFRVLDQGAIDPEKEHLTQLKQNLTDEVTTAVRRQLLAERSPPSPKPAEARHTGRRPGTGLGALIDCWMGCQQVADRFDSKREAYDAVYRALESLLKVDEVPARARIPKLRSDAKLRRQQLGRAGVANVDLDPVLFRETVE